MSIRGTKEANVIRDEIIKEWNNKGWGWDTHTGQATLKLLPIISSIMARELSEFKIILESYSDSINIAEIKSERAKDSILLYNALKRSGMPIEDISKVIQSFLEGEKIYEQSYKPENECSYEPKTERVF